MTLPTSTSESRFEGTGKSKASLNLILFGGGLNFPRAASKITQKGQGKKKMRNNGLFREVFRPKKEFPISNYQKSQRSNLASRTYPIVKRNIDSRAYIVKRIT